LSGGISGVLQKISTSKGRWISFGYDASGRVNQVSDHAGRTWSYAYDSSSYTAGRLYTATDPLAGVRYYTYDTSHRMLTIKDARGSIVLTNHYDANGRVDLQTYPDSSTTQFAYTVGGSGNVTQTDATDRRGNVRRVQFDANGYITSDTFALGKTEQQTYTFSYQSGTNFLTDATDAAGRSYTLRI
jgi:YD repeat-containing protein